MKELINTGTCALNWNRQTEKKEKTIVICGLPRSGTSMVAMLLKNVGIFLGDIIDNAVFEDIEMAKLLTDNDGKLEAFIQKRNAKHKAWGWKQPNAYLYNKKFIDKIRNPHFIILFRDYTSIAMRRSISARSDFSDNLQKIHQEYGALLQFISTCEAPVLVISYEKAITQKMKVIKSIFGLIDKN